MAWMEKIFSLVPDLLKVDKYASDIQDLSETIREDYQLSVKKAIVDFVLKDNRQLSVSYGTAIELLRGKLGYFGQNWCHFGP